MLGKPRGGVPASSLSTSSSPRGVRGSIGGSIRGVDGGGVRGSRRVPRVSVFGAALLCLLSQCCEDGVTYYSRPDMPQRATEDADQRGNKHGEEQDCEDSVDCDLGFHDYKCLISN